MNTVTKGVSMVGGPLDGCRITYGAEMPHIIYTLCRPNEGGYQPWISSPGERFRAEYWREADADGIRYRFTCYR